jgi:hypothetical protein
MRWQMRLIEAEGADIKNFSACGVHKMSCFMKPLRPWVVSNLNLDRESMPSLPS